jgi:probable rRNA maturation factor
MIRYFSEDISFTYSGKRLASRWLKAVSEAEQKTLGNIAIIFCSDAYLLQINKKYLRRDTFTDIITFDYCEGDLLSGDLFISIDTVRDNAVYYGTVFTEELNRVIVHGFLHLVGFDDRTEDQRKIMRKKEDEYLQLLAQLSV